MTRYEAIGCGVYELDPSGKPEDPRDPIADANEDMALRIADALNGSEALLEALKDMVHGLPELLESIGYADEENLIGKARAVLAAADTKAAGVTE